MIKTPNYKTHRVIDAMDEGSLSAGVCVSICAGVKVLLSMSCKSLSYLSSPGRLDEQVNQGQA